ncbi:type II toxin-antitoxin system HicB family antitoxin [Halobacteria archaeon HArc-gm2]|nr:type II toxin-antitoxin system HicB family antitoxin [Halobacteria archaeon HArc-gm2]
MVNSTSLEDEVVDEEIHLTREGDWWVAKDVETGVASQGETREEALEMLDEAVALHKGEIGREPTDEDLEEWGLDPDETGDKELPDFMQ